MATPYRRHSTNSFSRLSDVYSTPVSNQTPDVETLLLAPRKKPTVVMKRRSSAPALMGYHDIRKRLDFDVNKIGTCRKYESKRKYSFEAEFTNMRHQMITAFRDLSITPKKRFKKGYVGHEKELGKQVDPDSWTSHEHEWTQLNTDKSQGYPGEVHSCGENSGEEHFGETALNEEAQFELLNDAVWTETTDKIPDIYFYETPNRLTSGTKDGTIDEDITPESVPFRRIASDRAKKGDHCCFSSPHKPIPDYSSGDAGWNTLFVVDCNDEEGGELDDLARDLSLAWQT